LRAVAISMVVFQHGALFFYLCYGSPAIWTKTGTIGVTLFFALSGFLIGGILLDLGDGLRDHRVAARFWLRRALRTLPNYFLFIGINLAFWYVFQRQRDIQAPSLCFRDMSSSCRTSPRSRPGSSRSRGHSRSRMVLLLSPLALFLGLRLLRVPFVRLYWTLAAAMIALPVILRASTLSQEDWANGITKVVIYRPDSIAIGLAAVALSRLHPAQWARSRIAAAGAGVAVLAGSFLYMGLGDPEHSVFRTDTSAAGHQPGMRLPTAMGRLPAQASRDVR